MELYFLAAMIYLIIGTVTGRREYAKSISGDSDAAETLRRKAFLEAKLKGLKHAHGCWLGSRYRKTPGDYDCDCGHRTTWRKTWDELQRIDEGYPMTNAVNPYLVLMCWPVIGFDRFLKGGTVKSKSVDYAKIAELEQTELKELEI